MPVDLVRQSQVVTELRQRLETSMAMTKKVESEIADCERLEKHILENIRILKQDRIVVSVAEYKNAHKDLVQVRQGLIRLRSYRLERVKEVDNCTKTLSQAVDVFQKAEQEQKTTVIHVNFGGKHGQR